MSYSLQDILEAIAFVAVLVSIVTPVAAHCIAAGAPIYAAATIATPLFVLGMAVHECARAKHTEHQQ